MKISVEGPVWWNNAWWDRIQCLLGWHRWTTYQHAVTADSARPGDPRAVLVIAFKICDRCAESKLIHILV